VTRAVGGRVHIEAYASLIGIDPTAREAGKSSGSGMRFRSSGEPRPEE